MLRRSLGEDKLLELRLSPDAGELRADRGQLEQVLINLVLNARDALTGHGRVSIETANAIWDEVYAQRHGGVDIPLGRYVMLAVSDTGCGMEKDTQERIFEPFFTTKPIGQGTGLGLSTVYGIIKQSGGYIWVYSEPDHGSVFKVYLPQARVDAVWTSRWSDSPQTPTGGTETILVIEDEDIVRNLACRGAARPRLSGRRGPQWHPGAALHPGAPGTIDLVISDVVMPEMGGRELGQSLLAVPSRSADPLHVRLHRRGRRATWPARSRLTLSAEALHACRTGHEGARHAGPTSPAQSLPASV